MGQNLFGANISGQLAAAMGALLNPVTLIKVKPGTRNPANPSAGTNPTRRSFPCRGMVDSYRTSQMDGTIIKVGDRKVLVLGDTLPAGIVPEPNDEVRAESATYKVVAVERDPDAATYTIQVR